MNIKIGTKITATCILLLTGKALLAQDGFEVGLRYMVQKSMLINKSDKGMGDELHAENTMSYLNGGLAVGYHFNRHVGVEVDILNSRQGQSYTGTDPNPNSQTAAYTRQVGLQSAFNQDVIVGSYQAKAELNCLKIPVMLKLSTNRGKLLSLHLLAGPQINMITNVVYELNHADITLPGTNIKPNDAYKKVTFDGLVSPGADFKLSKRTTITADLRFDYGFQDAEQKNLTFSYLGLPEDKYYGPDRSATHNFTMGLMIGANFRL